ncbi:hypothetical protein BGZ94_002959 [Podila epigama]|nr:hypothetical protein BGZ94_002959 [Podila epigama]
MHRSSSDPIDLTTSPSPTTHLAPPLHALCIPELVLNIAQFLPLWSPLPEHDLIDDNQGWSSDVDDDAAAADPLKGMLYSPKAVIPFMLVTRTCYRTLLPILWHTCKFTVDGPRPPPATLARHGHLVHTLHVEFEDTWENALEDRDPTFAGCTQLERLTLRGCAKPAQSLVRQNPGLKYLSWKSALPRPLIYGTPRRGKHTVRPVRSANELSSCTRGIMSTRRNNGDGILMNSKRSSAYMSSSRVTHLCPGPLNTPVVILMDLLYDILQHHHSLVYLSLSRLNLSGEKLVQLLHTLPQLQRLELSLVGLPEVEDIQGLFLPSLVHLKLGCHETISRALSLQIGFELLARSCPILERLEFFQTSQIEQEHYSAPARIGTVFAVKDMPPRPPFGNHIASSSPLSSSSIVSSQLGASFQKPRPSLVHLVNVPIQGPFSSRLLTTLDIYREMLETLTFDCRCLSRQTVLDYLEAMLTRFPAMRVLGAYYIIMLDDETISAWLARKTVVKSIACPLLEELVLVRGEMPQRRTKREAWEDDGSRVIGKEGEDQKTVMANNPLTLVVSNMDQTQSHFLDQKSFPRSFTTMSSTWTHSLSSTMSASSSTSDTPAPVQGLRRAWKKMFGKSSSDAGQAPRPSTPERELYRDFVASLNPLKYLWYVQIDKRVYMRRLPSA